MTDASTTKPNLPPKPAPGVPALPHLNATTSFADAIFQGTPELRFRLRNEYAEQNTPLHPANALTLRSLLSLQTLQYYDLDAFLQVINVSTPNIHTYNSTKNNLWNYSIIADPPNTAVNQAYIGLSGFPSSYIKAGRQIINLDNQRFIGSVDFRQNMQNFDAASVVNQSIQHLTLFLAFLNQIDTITASEIKANDWLMNVKYNRMDYLNIVSYAYLLDHRGPIGSSLESTSTYGLRLTGNAPYKNTTLAYTAEYANQNAAANNPLSFNAYYYHLGASVTWLPISINVAQERLSGNRNIPNKAFRTPLATKHAFQGWADMFLVTPAKGINDTYISAGLALAQLIPSVLTSDMKFVSIYHDFKSQKAAISYGHEWDFELSKQLNKRYSTSLIYANFFTQSPTLYPNTYRVWLTLNAVLP